MAAPWMLLNGGSSQAGSSLDFALLVRSSGVPAFRCSSSPAMFSLMPSVLSNSPKHVAGKDAPNSATHQFLTMQKSGLGS